MQVFVSEANSSESNYLLHNCDIISWTENHFLMLTPIVMDPY